MFHPSYALVRTAQFVFGGVATCGLALCLVSRPAAAEGQPNILFEAYSACESKRSGEACVVRVLDFGIKGICAPDSVADRKLFCTPTDLPPLWPSSGSKPAGYPKSP
ncbi:MAG: hypothetical protein M3O46_07540 [Myxococcota bacterium]|nr:hypothetical protein [Myxococcota bacterium]